MSKRVTRCRSCSMCAYVMPAGFVSEPALHCTRLGDMPVDGDDGCTFGDRGEPFQARSEAGVDLATSHREYGFW